MRFISGTLAVGIGVLACAWLATSAAVAADREAAHGPFSVERAVLQGLAGTLAVRVVDGGEGRLTIKGPEEAVAGIAVAVEGDVLTVTAPARGRSVTVVDRMTVVTGQGASSSVVIGGNSASAASASSSEVEALDIVLELPVGTRLALLGFTGNAEIGDLSSDVVIQAVGGTVAIGAVDAADFATIGNGSVEAKSVEGDLAAAVTGNGRVTVAGGSIGAARVDITGAGEVVVDAPARSAVVNMIGNGTVRLAEVAEPPQVNRVGAGRFSVGPP